MEDIYGELRAFVQQQINTNQFLQGGALLGILTFIGYSLRPIPGRIWERIERKILFKLHIEETDELFYYFEVWLAAHHTTDYKNVEASLSLRKNPDSLRGEKTIGESESSEEKKTPKKKVFYKQYSDMFYLRRGWSFIRLSKGREKFEGAKDLFSAFYSQFTLSALFGKEAITNLIDEVVEYNESLRKKKTDIDIYSAYSYGEWHQVNSVYPKSMDSLIVPEKEILLNDIDEFMISKQWYVDRAILYKRGYMFYGKPGNGKTSLCLSLAKHINRSIYFLNLNNLNDTQLQAAFRFLTPNSILVIEDIDAAFDTKRKKNKDSEHKFSFSTLLNCLDGVFSKENVITIFTTNHPEKLDEALIRVGRIDVKIEIDNPSQKSIGEYLSIFYNREVKVDIENFENKIPMVEVQDICIKNKNNLKKALSIIESRTTPKSVESKEMAFA